MSGASTGGQRAAETNKKKHGKNFYKKIGKIGGTKSRGGGFASQKVGADGLTGKERAALAGSKGGQKRWNKEKSHA